MLPLIEDIPSFPVRIILYVALFLLALFLLEESAERFVESTAVLSHRLHVPPIAIALLTAGAEWEELAVVVVALAQGHSGLGLGNVLGSCTANILGSFSLGLLFPGPAHSPKMDTSARIYTALMMLVTALVCGLAWGNVLGRVAGEFLISTFVVYIAVIAYGIYRGAMDAPELSDSDSDSDSESSSGDGTDSDGDTEGQVPSRPRPNAASDRVEPTESAPLLPSSGEELPSSTTSITSAPVRRPKFRTNTYHLFCIVGGLLALSLAGYLLAGSSTAFADAAGLTDTVVGLTILSFATTLPEKIVAVLAARRGQASILVANTVGGNVFLLTLVLGIILIVEGELPLDNKTRLYDVSVVLGSAVLLSIIIFTGYTRRWVGAAFLVAYIAYIVGNFVVDSEW
ncbi:Sodium/calcium exchanger protein-domain-containing protein [Powellomyces hirtus]|nr:Sodium/calcium exchanger protein-domain-containing protein [Powellomyces hirtus]